MTSPESLLPQVAVVRKMYRAKVCEAQRRFRCRLRALLKEGRLQRQRLRLYHHQEMAMQTVHVRQLEEHLRTLLQSVEIKGREQAVASRECDLTVEKLHAVSKVRVGWFFVCARLRTNGWGIRVVGQLARLGVCAERRRVRL